jgi:hypothetical protein
MDAAAPVKVLLDTPVRSLAFARFATILPIEIHGR